MHGSTDARKGLFTGSQFSPIFRRFPSRRDTHLRPSMSQGPWSGLAPKSKIVQDLDAVAENYRLGRDGGFVPPKVEATVWAYDPNMGSTFDAQRVDSRYPNAPTVPYTTALRRKADRQFVNPEMARKQLASHVTSRTGGEQPLPGPAAYSKPGTFGRPNADARVRNGHRFKFTTTPRFPNDERGGYPGIGQYKPYVSMSGRRE